METLAAELRQDVYDYRARAHEHARAGRGLLKENKFDVKRLIRDLPELKAELESLDKLGFIGKDKDIPGGCAFAPASFFGG